MAEQAYRHYIGIDWGSETHQVCALDNEGRTIGERSVRHDGAELSKLVSWLMSLVDGDPNSIAIAIEVPRGPVVELLVERGFHVFALNPKQLDRFRDRFTVAGAKDDRRDAFVLASSVRTDRCCFRRIELDTSMIVQLRELSRAHDELVVDRNRLSNRLWNTLLRYFPSLIELAPGADEAWLWELLGIAPTPAACARLTPERVRAILRHNHIRRFDENALIERLRRPPLDLAAGTVDACVASVTMLLPRLRVVDEQLRKCDHALDKLLKQLTDDPCHCDDANHCEHRDARILLSHPGIGTVVAATMLAEASQALRCRDYHALRALVGVAPVTRASGKSRTVSMRRACNGRLRDAMQFWICTGIRRDEQTRKQYASLRARGHNHNRAVRGVADRRLKILVATLRQGTIYDATRTHTA